jgi:hypothetical protein
VRLAADDVQQQRKSKQLLAELAHTTADDCATAAMLVADALPRAEQAAARGERRVAELRALINARVVEQRRRMTLLKKRQQAARAAIDADERTVRALQTEIDATEQQLAALIALSTLETTPPTSASLTTCRQR